MSLICCKQINDLSLIKKKLKKIEIHKYSSIEDRLTDFFDKRELKILNVLGENWNNFDSIEINGIKYKLKKINTDFLINEKYKNYTFQNTNKVIYKSLLENNIKEKNKKINLINSLTKNDKNNNKNNKINYNYKSNNNLLPLILHNYNEKNKFKSKSTNHLFNSNKKLKNNKSLKILEVNKIKFNKIFENKLKQKRNLSIKIDNEKLNNIENDLINKNKNIIKEEYKLRNVVPQLKIRYNYIMKSYFNK
jgi:hypothetical protein